MRNNSDINQNKVNYRLYSRKMISVVMIISLAPMALAAGAILYQFNASYREKVYAHIGELILKHKQEIDAFLTERLADINYLHTLYGFEKLKDESFLREQLNLLRNTHGIMFEDLGVIDQTGQQLAYAGPYQLSNADYKDAVWFKGAIKQPTYISDVFLGKRGLPHFIVTVKGDYQNSKWLLRATIDFLSFNALVANLTIGETGFAYILNQNWEYQTTPRFQAALEKSSDEQFLNLDSQKDGYVVIEKSLGNNDKYILASTPLKNGEWHLIFQQNVNDAYADLWHAQRITTIIFVISGIAIVFFAYYLSGRIVNRLVAADSDKEIMSRQIIESAKLASLGELAAGFAHEINNPVAIMMEEAGWMQDLMEDSPSGQCNDREEFERSLNQIRIQGQRCKEITYKLLSFARKTEFKPDFIQVNQLVQEVTALISQQIKYSNVTVSLNLESNLPEIRASGSEMQQVFLNLINNASDALEKKGGHIDIRTKSVEQAIQIEFSDNGPGIPQAILDRIFDPFFTTKPVGKGTGLGLSICYGIIHKMGGKIEVDSVVGQGTTFRINLPKSIEAQDETNIA